MSVSGYDDLRKLPATLEYTGEFGREVVLFVPFIRWLSASGILKTKHVLTYKGMHSYYEDLEYSSYREKDQPREFVPSHRLPTWLPWADEHNFDSRRQWPFFLFQDERQRYQGNKLKISVESNDKPLLIIHNKVANEWSSGPINTMQINDLEKLFAVLKRDHTVVYLRHGTYEKPEHFTQDHNESIDFDEAPLFKRHPEIKVFHEAFNAERSAGGITDLNTFKCALYARCWRFITVQGGGAHQISGFSGSLMVILHIQGSDIKLSYNHGYYSSLANPAPTRLICRTSEELVDASAAFTGISVIDGRSFPNREGIELVRKYSPFRFIK